MIIYPAFSSNKVGFVLANIQKWSAYIKGSANRQEFLERALDWGSRGDIGGILYYSDSAPGDRVIRVRATQLHSHTATQSSSRVTCRSVAVSLDSLQPSPNLEIR